MQLSEFPSTPFRSSGTSIGLSVWPTQTSSRSPHLDLHCCGSKEECGPVLRHRLWATALQIFASPFDKTLRQKVHETSALTQSRYRLKTVFQLPKKAGRSRHGLPVRTIQSNASMKRRLSPPLRPGSAGLPRQCGSIFAHWASVSTNRSIQSLNHNQAKSGILNLNKP